MRVDGLIIPELLLMALDAGRWPRTADEALTQNLRPWMSKERVQQLAPDESQVYLYPPPFTTVARILTTSDGEFYTRYGALDQIEPEGTIEIADFGIGADSTIVLDYRVSPSEPRVLRLVWPGRGLSNHWVVMATDFRHFIDALGLLGDNLA
jgi:hypothetical protein